MFQITKLCEFRMKCVEKYDVDMPIDHHNLL